MSTPPVGGRLALHVKEWEKLSSHQWVIQTVRGYKIPFIATPPYMPPPTQRPMTQEQVYIIEQEIANLLQKRAIEPTSSETGFHSRIFAVPKKDGGWRPVLDLSNLNQCHEYPLQDGIPDQPEGSDQPRRLSHKDRPQGCLPDGPSTQGITILPQIQVEEQHVSVCDPPFRIGPSPVCIHEAPPASSSSFQEKGGEDHDLHRRYPHPSIQSTCSIKTSCRSPGSSPESGFRHQLGKIRPISTTNPGVSGDDSRHHPDGTETSTGQSSESPKGVLDRNCEDHYHPQDFNETDWENDSHHSGNTGSTSPLQIPSSSYQPTSQPRNPLGREHYPHSSVQRGYKLVDSSPSQSEWEKAQKSHSEANIGNRCFQDRMGSDNRKERNIRKVVPGRVTTTHKFIGVESNGSSTKDLLQTHVGLSYPHKERQSSGSEIHQYKGGNSLSDSEQGSDPDMDLVQAKEFDDPRGVSTRKLERVGRCRVEKESRNERLEIGSSHLSTIATSQWPTGDRLVCSKTQHTAGELLQLASRSRCSRDRCIQIQLNNTERLCIPTILPSGQMSEKSDSGQSVEASSYSPSVASSSMVSSTPGFIGGTPSAANTISNIASGSKGNTHPLLQAGSLHLASWTVSYNSLMRKEFRKTLQSSSKLLGEKELKNRMQQHGENGAAGVIEGKQIQFQHL